MDTIDKILHQIRDKDYDLSFGENLMAPQSVDQLQATVAFPDEKVHFYQCFSSQDTSVETFPLQILIVTS